jgi:glycosyltransferase involved in cell wall biosynthesis
MMPNVSVVIPTYNRANYVLDAVESVRNQTYQDFEIIVIDDGSTDNTREVLSRLIDEEAIVYHYQENSGESSARNRGISLAKGTYIAFLDSDDLFQPTKLEKQVDYLDNYPNDAFVHSWYSKFDNTGKDLGRRKTSIFSGWIYPKALLTWKVLISPSCVMVRSRIMDEVGGFDVDQYWGADLDMWRRIILNYPIGCIPEVLAEVRVHPENLSANKADALPWFERYLQKAFDDDPDLGLVFQRRALAKLYTNIAHNLLGEGSPEAQGMIRRLSLNALKKWLFIPGAFFGYGMSFLPLDLRLHLLRLFRSWRNPAVE